MNGNEFNKYLTCAMEVGENLLESGAEVGRVEDTIGRICRAYGAERVDVFTITSSIVVTAYVSAFESCTQSRRISRTSTDMTKIDALNQLSRDICRNRMEPDRIMERLRQIRHTPKYPAAVQVLAYALVAGSFAVFFGGTLQDGFAAALLGAVMWAVETVIRKKSTNLLLIALGWSVVGGLLCSLIVYLRIGVHSDMISIGNIMLFIPGIAFTNSIRDLFAGDTISGIIRFLEAVILAVAIAFGFALTVLI